MTPRMAGSRSLWEGAPGQSSGAVCVGAGPILCGESAPSSWAGWLLRLGSVEDRCLQGLGWDRRARRALPGSHRPPQALGPPAATRPKLSYPIKAAVRGGGVQGVDFRSSRLEVCSGRGCAVSLCGALCGTQPALDQKLLWLVCWIHIGSMGLWTISGDPSSHGGVWTSVY